MLALSSAPVVLRRLRRRRLSGKVIGFASLVMAYVVLAVFGPIAAPYSTTAIAQAPPFLGVSGAHWLGTDELGRDELSRILAAARVGIEVAFVAVALALVCGCLMGIIAGYIGGLADAIVSRLSDFLFVFPEFLLAILVVAALGPGIWNAALTIGIVYAPRFARVSRSQVRTIKLSSYIDAAVIARRSRAWIMTRHVLPNIAGPVAVLTALSLSTAQLSYAGLSFLGFGARPPAPDYGSMLQDGTSYMIGHPLLVIAPAIALSLLILGFNIIGDLARDLLDPRMRRSSVRAVTEVARGDS